MEGQQFDFSNYPLKDIPGPHPHDVLCGRGGGTNNHVGNSHWRMLVAANKQLYVTLPKRQKMLLSRSIVNAVRSQNPPGRFLQKDAKSDLWYDVGDQRAQEKTSQALREGAPDIRSKLAKSDAPPTEDSTKYDTGDKNIKSSNVAAPPNQNITQQNISAPAPAMMAATTNPPPGSTPVMVYAMPQSGMPGMPMYPAVMTAQGMMVPTAMHGMPSSFPPPVPPQVPNQKPADNGNNHQAQAPFPPQTESTDIQTAAKLDSATVPPANTNTSSRASKPGVTFDEDIEAAMMTGALEPSGISFGSASMMSVGTSAKLEPGGTSFGSVMSFSVASTKAPDMVDGGLEPIGTSFGSLSLNSTERNHLQRALQQHEMGQQMGDLKQAPKTFATPTLLSQQRSTGNLLECSDTESEEEEEDNAQNQPSKSAEWEKLKAMVEKHTVAMEQNPDGASMPPPVGEPFEAIPHTGFERDFSNISAISMGEFEELGNLSPVVEHKQYPLSDDKAAMPPPPPMPSKGSNDANEALSEREQLEMMYLAQAGAMNFGNNGGGYETGV